MQPERSTGGRWPATSTLPNYRNYWKQAGYEDEMVAIEAALAAGDRDELTELMTDAWIDDCTISGSARRSCAIDSTSGCRWVWCRSR